MSRNSTIMLTHYAWPPNPLFDAIKFISTGNRSLLVFFFFLFLFFFFFSKNFESRNLFPSIVEVFSSREIRPPISSLRMLLTTYAKIVGFGAARDVKPIRPLVEFFRKCLTIFSSSFALVLLRLMPLSWVILVSFAVVLLVARIIYDISEKSSKLLKISGCGCLQKYLLTQ